ncbi:MAG: hypothetical protein Q9163_003340 [Psora crenata]
MAKRSAEETTNDGVPLKSGERPQKVEKGTEEADFEDEFEDEYESEDEVLEAGVDGRPDEDREAEEKDAMDVDKRTFIPGRDKLQKGESLSPDSSAYEMLHSLSTVWPCLSFDIVPDSLGESRKTYPATLYAVAGTQAESRRAKDNQLLVMKLSALGKMDRNQDSDTESDDSLDESAEPILETKSLPLSSTTNRIRAHQIPAADSSHPATTFTATMLESAELQIHNITPHLNSFDMPGTMVTPQESQPIATIKVHRSEGYAVAWSPLFPAGKLLSGDNDGKIFVTAQDPGGKWTTDTRPFTGHQGSVEDLQWSPNERNVFASASSDGTVKVWDTRSKSRKPAVSVAVSDTDVNVLSWSTQTPHLLATGADDGRWAVWDLRQWKPLSSTAGAAAAPKPVAEFHFHKEQITSLEWHPTDDSIVAVAAADNTLTLWDLAVELDDEESRDTADAKDVPPQLLFVHYLEDVKECHWHAQIPGVVVGTGGGGFG